MLLGYENDFVLFFRWPTSRAQWLSTFKNFSESIQNSSSASFTKNCHNTLHWAFSIFLLVRQQLERIDQVFTQTLRYRMRFEDFCLAGTDSCLYHQQPAGRSPFMFFCTDCAPPTAVLPSSRYTPKVVLQKKTVAMLANVRQSDTSLSSGWRDDTSQEICALQHNSLYDVLSFPLHFLPLFQRPLVLFGKPIPSHLFQP